MAQFRMLPDGKVVNLDRVVEVAVVGSGSVYDVVAYTDGAEAGATGTQRRRVVVHPARPTRAEAVIAMCALVGIDPTDEMLGNPK